MKTAVPFGAWISPVTTDLMTAAAISLGALTADGDALYWLEGRPSESGRTVLCRRAANGTIEDLTPPPVNVGSRVHEYGGGAFGVEKGVVIYSERKDGSIWLIERDAPPRRIATPEGCRYADFEFDSARRRVLAVREDHRDRPPTNPKAAIVALPLDGESRGDRAGRRPRFPEFAAAFAGRKQARLDRLGSSRHALGPHPALLRRPQG